MKSSCDLYFYFILLAAIFIKVVHSAPHDFCTDTFDDGDCGEAPTDVFYYYKSGSRCEVRTWRGCPTLNRFPDQFSCLHFCVMRIWGGDGEPVTGNPEDDLKEDWIEDLTELDVEDIEAIDKILEDMVEDVKHNPQKLTLHKKKRKPDGGNENSAEEGEDSNGGGESPNGADGGSNGQGRYPNKKGGGSSKVKGGGSPKAGGKGGGSPSGGGGKKPQGGGNAPKAPANPADSDESSAQADEVLTT